MPVYLDDRGRAKYVTFKGVGAGQSDEAATS
jgi:hypothetical protein